MASSVLRQAPDWLVLIPPITLEADSVTVLRPSFDAATPAGEHKIDLEMEVTNLHVGPGRNLTVTMPLTVRR